MALDQVGEGLPADAPSGVVRNLGVKDYVLAGLAGLLAAAAILVWGIPGLDPSMSSPASGGSSRAGRSRPWAWAARFVS